MKLSKIILVLVLAAILISPVFVSAATNAGVKPGSFWYRFDITFEKINLFFTFNSESKVIKALKYADERLAEIEAVANENKPEAVAAAMVNYQENVSLATAESKDIKDKEKAQNLLSTIADNTSKHQEVLSEVYDKVPDEAKTAIEKAIEVSIKGHEEALKEIQGLKKTVEELQKDIESLKQQGQSDQSKEMEVLRKEIETLKSQQSSQSAKPQIIEKVVEKIVEVPPTTPQKSTVKLSNSEIIEKVKPTVVYIETSEGAGSGIIIETDGLILTNAHVVKGVNSVKVKLSDKRLFVGSIVGRDELVDLALIKINVSGLVTVEFGNSDVSVLRQGDEVFALGYPFGLEGDVSFKEGTISRRQEFEGITYLETSAETYPGNSGGPLVNRFGQVIGINTLGVGVGAEGILLGESIKLAIPVNAVNSYVPELKAGRNVIKPEPVVTPEPIKMSAQEDPALKIARCQAESREKINNIVNLALSEYLPEFQKLVDDAHAAWLAIRQEQLNCTLSPLPEDMIGASPSQIMLFRDGCARAKQPTVDYYANAEQYNRDLWETAKQETRRMGNESYNSIYLSCLNK